MMRVSAKGLAAIAAHEGVVPAPYLDSVNVWTFGIGHTASAGPPDPARMPRGMPADLEAAIRKAAEVFCRDLEKYEARVRAAVKVPLAQHEFDALVSFDFNTGGINRARLTRLLNAGDRDGAADAFMGWLRPPEIRKRREGERDLFRTGVYPAKPIPLYTVSASGRVGRPLRMLALNELIEPRRPVGGRPPD